MWGFGMRYAITSGALAAHSIMERCDYEKEIRGRLVPLVRASAINRFLMNRVSNRGFKMVATHWIRDEKRHGDGLHFMKWVYQPGIFRRALWPVVKFAMLRRKQLKDGRMVSRMPFRKSLSRDVWEPSARAIEIGEEWKSIQRGGGQTSFAENEA